MKKELQDLKKSDPSADATQILKRYLRESSGKKEKYDILLWLSLEYSFQNKHTEFEDIIEQAICLMPDAPDPWYYLAEHFLYMNVDLERAERSSKIAVTKALSQRQFVRPTLGTRIRVALKREDYKAVQEAIKQLIEYIPEDNEPEIQLETDFIKKIPKGKVKKSILDQYLRKLD